jgi:hypothetical protein
MPTTPHWTRCFAAGSFEGRACDSLHSYKRAVFFVSRCSNWVSFCSNPRSRKAHINRPLAATTATIPARWSMAPPSLTVPAAFRERAKAGPACRQWDGSDVQKHAAPGRHTGHRAREKTGTLYRGKTGPVVCTTGRTHFGTYPSISAIRPGVRKCLVFREILRNVGFARGAINSL